MDVKQIGAYDKCPMSLGLYECPESHPYSYKQGMFCCPTNIDYIQKSTSQPYLNFDS